MRMPPRIAQHRVCWPAMPFYRFCGVLLLAACLGACASHRGGGSAGSSVATRGTYKVGAPYAIDGVTYVPQEEFNHVETGVASWYGPGFHGKATANGEQYNQEDHTAAHRTLQMPAIVRVTNLDERRRTIGAASRSRPTGGRPETGSVAAASRARDLPRTLSSRAGAASAPGSDGTCRATSPWPTRTARKGRADGCVACPGIVAIRRQFLRPDGCLLDHDECPAAA
jgi:rare lipoprotein A